MGRKKSSGAGTLIIVAIVIIVAIGRFIADHLVPVLIVGAIAVGLWITYALASKTGSNQSASQMDPPTASTMEQSEPASSLNPSERSSYRNFSSSRLRQKITSPTYAANGARPPSTNGDEFWISPPKSGAVSDQQIGSLLYVGRGLRAVSSDAVEPALVDPQLPVAPGINECSERRLTYWSSFSEASEEARAAYLYWLRTGRRDPHADIGYVFLYFYGLERRAVHDTRTSASAAAEIPLITREVERLLSIYGQQRSFRGYATTLLDFLSARSTPVRSYLSPPVDRGGPDLTVAHRLALSQCAADRAPLPAEWAHLWVTHDRSVSLGTVPRRCTAEFRRMFEILYREQCGDGVLLPKNRTMLKLEYRPASASLLGAREDLSIEPGLPDVSVLSSPVRKLVEIAERASEKLGRYSRILGKDPATAGSFEALVELPIALWPETYRKQLEAVRDVVARAGRPAAVPFEKFRTWMPSFAELSRAKLRALYVALSGVGLGMEPDVRFGGSTPSLDSRVVLFADDPESATEQGSARYLAASLTLQLGAAVAAADGEVEEAERALLTKQMEEWLSLTESERRRLHAHLRLLLLEPPKLTGLKKRIESLDLPSRDAVANFLALVAQADDRVTPDEIRQLQKIFRLLGLDPEGVFSKIHAAAVEPVSVTPTVEGPARKSYSIPSPPHPSDRHSKTSRSTASRQASGLNLDPAKILALQKDSERVASILASVFDAPVDSMADVSASPSDSATAEDSDLDSYSTRLLGLDAVHSALLETLLTRTQWARAELEELAEDRDLMLDGSLERVNEAYFDQFDQPLFEGEDPLVLSSNAARQVLEPDTDRQ